MVNISFNYQAVRARNARLSARLGSPVLVIENSLFTILGGLALYLLVRHNPLGYTAAGASLLAAITAVWHLWDLRGDDGAKSSLSNESIQLERVVDHKLLAQLRSSMSPADLWASALANWQGVFVIQRLQLPHHDIGTLLSTDAQASQPIWQQAVMLSRTYQTSFIDSGVVIASTLLTSPEIQPMLQKLGVMPEDIISVLSWQQRVVGAIEAQHNYHNTGGIGRDWASGYTPLLSQRSINLTREVEAGYHQYVPTDHVAVVNQLVIALSGNHPVALVGKVGSGKTAIMYSLADRLIRNEGAGGLSYYQVLALSASALISGEGTIEDTVMQLLIEAAQAKNTIIFLDDAQLFLSSGPGAVDLSRILLPILQRGVIKLALALTEHDWQQLSSEQPALAGLLERLTIAEPATADTIAVAQDVALTMESKAKVTILQPAIKEAVKLAERYLTEAAFPGKAITVLETASRYPESGYITAGSVQQAIEATTGAKVTKATQPEKDQLLNLENQIHERMINQTRAVKAVADALRRSRAGVTNPRRPVGSFLFLGPTGVGKTELTKALAAIYYGAESAMIRLDMSEYQQPNDVDRLLASASQSTAGQTLAAAVRQSPSSVVLLDEIEKAHPDVLNLLLQILDEGRLTDSDGRVISFKDAIVIATSNAAADDIRARIEKGEQLDEFEPEITKQLIESHQFKPELLNRFDEIVVFRPLSKPELGQVVQLLIKQVNATLEAQSVSVALTTAASDWLVEHGYDPAFGARPLRRIVQRTVENIVAERLLAGTLTGGDTLTLDASDLEPTASQV